MAGLIESIPGSRVAQQVEIGRDHRRYGAGRVRWHRSGCPRQRGVAPAIPRDLTPRRRPPCKFRFQLCVPLHGGVRCPMQRSGSVRENRLERSGGGQ